MKAIAIWLRCRLLGHKLIIVSQIKNGLLVKVPLCERSRRAARRRAARRIVG